MNLKKLLDMINAKKIEVQNLVTEDKLEDAKKAKEELIALQNKYDLLKDIITSEEGGETAPKDMIKPVEDKHDAIHEFANAIRTKFQNLAAEGVPGDGGYTVPEDIVTRINRYKEDKFKLEDYVSVEVVTTNKGRRTYQKKTQHTGFKKVAEGGKIGATATPQFETVSYDIGKYAGYLPVTNELLADSDANITNVMVNWLGEEDIATRNNLILTLLKTKAATAIKNLDGIKNALNVTLDQAYTAGAVIMTNSDGLNYIDTLKDTTGRYLLSPDAQNPMQMVLAVGARKVPVIVAPNKIIASDVATGMPFFVGDLKEAVKIFDRQKLSVMTSNVAAVGELNAFEEDLTIFRAIDRLDAKAQDTDAYVYLTLKVGE